MTSSQTQRTEEQALSPELDSVPDTGDVSIFEVSPRGTFMLSVVQNELLQLKYLPKGIIDHFNPLVEPIYLVDLRE